MLLTDHLHVITQHRSPISFAVHLLAGLVAYSFQEKKQVYELHVLKRRSLCRSEVN